MSRFDLSSLSLKSRFTLLIAANLLATGLLLSQALHGFETLHQDAQQSFVAKDVVADILPPPMYLIELRLVLSQALEQSITPPQAQAELQRLQTEYEARVQHWSAHPPHGLERQLLGEQHRQALQLLTVAREQVIAPPVQTGP